MFLSVAGLIMTLVAGLGGGFSTPGTSSGDSGYKAPGLEKQAELDQIRNDINLEIKHLRHNEQVPPVLMDPFELQREAQDHAEKVAVAGQLQNSEQNVTMLQHHLPESGTSGHAFLEAWLHSQAHTDVVLDPRYVFYGIGVAVGHGEVWVAVQFSES
ncbi:CAP domain-containing protein [Corynebacterium hylobatis]|uniref:CAP domain-containing protein n=1 Tax=Corynebacterium hylobatis TaxID=1859290 RepID=A0A3S0BHI0_9CORY|nr:CAP domain-containing protein [Corynebacterium hylobatis]RSZ63218.1 CAP domain-containing protein [Corynebacterium hylobatis]